MAENKKQDFVVSDKRKFTLDGELRTGTEAERDREETPAAQARPTAPKPPAESTSQAKQESAPFAAENLPPVSPPTSAEQQAQHEAYRQSGKQFESPAASGRSAHEFEMNFERLLGSLYMTAMMQLGLMHEESQQPVADLVGAKQTIDTLGVLQEKTKGNLTDAEANLLQNALYELRMAFVELTNAIARGPQSTPVSPSGKK